MGDKIAEQFINWVEQHRNPAYSKKHNNFMVTFGNDFNYSSNKGFINIDKLIKYIRNDKIYSEKYDIQYSTPACYANNVKEIYMNNPEMLGLYEDNDFFPYADFEHAYWTGYYSSKPTFKKKVREAGNFLNCLSQRSAFKILSGEEYSSSTQRQSLQQCQTSLKKAISIAQHHDAISGTEKDHVEKDYINRLDKAVDQCYDHDIFCHQIFEKAITPYDNSEKDFSQYK